MTMFSNEYQWKVSRRTIPDMPDMVYTDYEVSIARAALGLSAAAGDVAQAVNLAVFDQQLIDRDQLGDKIGAVLWHVAALCTKLDLNLSDVMAANIEKHKGA